MFKNTIKIPGNLAILFSFCINHHFVITLVRRVAARWSSGAMFQEDCDRQLQPVPPAAAVD